MSPPCPAGRLDGERDALLAPIRGPDTRRDLPQALFRRNGAAFLAKTGIALGLLGLSWVVVAATPGPALTGLAIIVAGMMMAHLVELQHECLHGHAFGSRRLDRWAGVACGLFMLSSHSHYRYGHLRHHAYLGTTANDEFFDYRFQGLNSPLGFLRGMYDMGRFPRLARDMALSVAGRPLPGVAVPREAARIRQEYRLYLAVLLAAVAASLALGSWFLVLAWLVPLVAVAEPVHFLIEMPEHYGLDTQNEADVLSNTRTIRAGAFARWLTNANNLHTAHHYHQGVPMAGIRQLDAMISDRVRIVEPSYPAFYRKVISGRISHNPDGSCMTR
ncbi:MAG: fatty acid desaturase [Azospirillaceae bacterium]